MRPTSPRLDFHATAGHIDYSSVLTGPGTSDVTQDPATNDSASNATLTITQATGTNAAATLVVPIHFTITSDLNGQGQGVFTFNGSITARRTTIAGDANFDGVVNLLDFNTLAGNFNQTNRHWCAGDFNFDGSVNLLDFNLLAGNFNQSAAGPEVTLDDWGALASAVGANVPEPASMLTLTGVAASMAMRSAEHDCGHDRIGNICRAQSVTWSRITRGQTLQRTQFQLDSCGFINRNCVFSAQTALCASWGRIFLGHAAICCCRFTD